MGNIKIMDKSFRLPDDHGILSSFHSGGRPGSPFSTLKFIEKDQPGYLQQELFEKFVMMFR
jgi:hypothetical protein